MNLYLVRHAHAGSRGRWNGPDAERPLSAKGRDEADDITASLAAAKLSRVISSPAVRCVQTVVSLAADHGLEVEVDPAIREGAPIDRARALIDDLLRAGTDAVVCGHGDILPELLNGFEAEGVVMNGAGCAKGSLWHLVGHNGRFERATYHRHPEPGQLQDR